MGVLEATFAVATGRRLKIAYVVDIFDDNAAGAVQSSRRFVEGLRQRHDVTVISTGASHVGKVCVPRQRILGFQWIIEKNGFAFGSPAADILRQALPGHDVVYIHYTLPLGYSALREARKLGMPVVFGQHFQPQNVFYNLRINWPWLNNALARFFVRNFYNRADHVVCPSRHALQELEQHGFSGAASIISNGLPRRFAPRIYPRPERFKNRFVILMVSRLAREKRHELVLRAIARSPHRHNILLVATGQGPVQGLIEKLARKHAIACEVGYVDDAQLLEFYNTADLMVHASEAELEGMAVLEAIGCGLPALIAQAKNSATSQFAIDERFLFPAGDVAALQERIDHWIEHPESLHVTGREYLAKSRGFGFADALQELEGLLLRLAGYSAPVIDVGTRVARQESIDQQLAPRSLGQAHG